MQNDMTNDLNNSVMTVKDNVSAAEWQMRVDLAACYRLIAMYGWDDLVFTTSQRACPIQKMSF